MIKHQKNEEYNLHITDMGTNGEGIGHLEDGYTLFVNNAVVGDVILARIIKPQKNYGIGKLMRILSPSPDRISPICPHSDKCGGCQIASLSYSKQLELKENKVRELLSRVGGFDPEYIKNIFHPIIGFYHNSDEAYSDTNLSPTRFRNKAQYPVGTDENGNIITGFYTAHSHRIIPAKDCLIGAPSDAPILSCVKEYMSKYHIPAYDEQTHSGLIRHILIRTGFYTGDIMVCFVINGVNLPEEKALVELLTSLKLPVCSSSNTQMRITSITLSSNTAKTNVIMGDSYKTIWGDGYITDKIGDISFRISPLSFFQVNPVQTNKLYSLALNLADLTGKEIVWDLYCGIGTISLFLAQRAKHVYGVEIIPQAIENAKENASLNNIENASFFVGKAEEVLPDFYNGEIAIESEALSPDVIVVDPPRKGLDTSCIDTIIQMSPSRIVYVSCDPATLSRDLKLFCSTGNYLLESVTPVDMFPHSSHCETVVLLSQREKRSDISLSLDIKPKASKAETKATYKEIKEYVKQYCGLTVSSLNIAQVKNAHGIIERENYNFGNEGHRVPNCPEEKFKAIEDALRHFQMI